MKPTYLLFLLSLFLTCSCSKSIIAIEFDSSQVEPLLSPTEMAINDQTDHLNCPFFVSLPSARYYAATVQPEKKIEREQVAQVTGTNKDDSAVREPKRRTEVKIYPNAPCPCGSGKKYKNCHGRNL